MGTIIMSWLDWICTNADLYKVRMFTTFPILLSAYPNRVLTMELTRKYPNLGKFWASLFPKKYPYYKKNKLAVTFLVFYHI